MTTTTLPNKAPRGHFFVNGAFLQGENFQTYARKNGLCDICGKFQTHEKHGRIFKKVFTPLTVKNDKGEYQVYKGMCIQPTCYTLDEAKQRLFTTHESNLLDLDIFRQDEIWFAEKNQEGATQFYPLSEFKIRYDLDIRKGYLNGRFGAIPFLENLEKLNQNTHAEEEPISK